MAPSHPRNCLEPHHMVRLPTQGHSSVFSKLSPSDVLNFFRVHPAFAEIARGCHKRWHHVSLGKDALLVEKLGRDGRVQRHLWNYSMEESQVLDDELPFVFHTLTKAELRKINSTPSLDGATEDHLNIGLKVSFLHYPKCTSISLLQTFSENLNITALTLGHEEACTIHSNAQLFEFFLRNKKITTANFSVFGSEGFGKASELRLPKQWMKIYDHGEGIEDEVYTVVEEVIQQWECNERDVNAWMLCLETSERNEFLYEAIYGMASRLAADRSGSFRREVPACIQLIERKDGSGLLILTAGPSVLLISCHYEYRRKRGLGFGSLVQAHHRRLIRSGVQQLEKVEADIWRFARFGLQPEINDDTVEEITKGLYDFSLDDRDIANVIRSQLERLHDLLEGARSNVESRLRCYMANFSNVPKRELIIDTLFLGSGAASHVNHALLDHLYRNGFEPSGFPDAHYKKDEQHKVLHEYIDYYKKHGSITSYYC
ncbi:unnamed protein product, partial [Mesorhabditis spiculigera]